MTIKDLAKIIKKTSSTIYIPMANCRGLAMAIDAGILIYSKAATAYSKVVDQTNVIIHEPDLSLVREFFFRECSIFINKLLSLGIEPVLVFDGPTPVSKKEEASVKRAEKRNKDKIKLAELEGKLSMVDPLSIDVKLLNEKRNLMKRLPPYFGEWANDLKLLCKSLHLLYAVSTEESDRLASALVRDGLCVGVYTTDYDVLVHGTHLMFKGFDWNEGQECFVTVSLESLMREIKLSYPMLVDLAVLLGCDYNAKTRGEKIKRVGEVTALKLIKEHRNIESLPPKQDWGALKHLECRKLFYPIPSAGLILETNFAVKESKLVRQPPSSEVTDFRDMASSMGISTDTTDFIAKTISNTLRSFLGVIHPLKAYSPMIFDFYDYGFTPSGSVSFDLPSVGGEAARTVKPTTDTHPLLT